MIWTAGPYIQPETRRASAPATRPFKNNHPFNQENQTCCSGGHAHGCGCSCPTCCCRSKPVQNNPNQTNYNGEGGHNVPEPEIDATHTELRSSSVNTNNSGFSTNAYINNSWEAQLPLSARMMTEDFGPDRHTYSATAAIQNVEAAFTSNDVDDDGHEWGDYISPPESQSFMEQSDDDLENMADSMHMEIGEPTDDAATLLSTYSNGFASATGSHCLTGTGTFFTGNNFLRLTPDCRHEKTRQMCGHCMHY